MTLPRCLDSLLDQTFQDFEVIIVDDGSTDNSLEICRKYANKDSRFLIYHKENGGASSTRQYGVDQLSDNSVYSIHVDPDDWVEPEISLMKMSLNKRIKHLLRYPLDRKMK